MSKNKNIIYIATAHEESIAGSRVIVGRTRDEFEERFIKAITDECVDGNEVTDFVRSFEFCSYDLVADTFTEIGDPNIFPIKWDVEFDYPE